MVRPVAPLAIVLVLLAGCSGGPGPAGESIATTSPTVTTVVGERIEPVFTDTLHVLGHPNVTTRAPDSYSDLRVPVPSIGDGLAAAAARDPAAGHWRHRLPDGLSGVVGTATFWVEVRGTVVNNPNPLVEGCFWQFRFVTGSADTGNSHFAPCVKENATVAEGVRQITFTFDLPQVVIAPGEVLDFELYTGDAGRAPDATVDLLTASIAHDSRVQLAGLRLEVDSGHLLAIP